MKLYQKSLLIFVLCITILVIAPYISYSQFIRGPYFNPWGSLWGTSFYASPLLTGLQYPILPPLYGLSQGWNNPLSPLIPAAPAILAPYQRAPNATIIFTSPTLTAINTAPGVIVVGNTAALAAPTIVAPTVAAAPVVTTPAPAPLFSILAILYAQALVAPAALSTANPLLFAYLQTLLL